MYPNASDPLNGEAAALMMRDHTAYDQRVKGRNSKHSLVNLSIISSSLISILKSVVFFHFKMHVEIHEYKTPRQGNYVACRGQH